MKKKSPPTTALPANRFLAHLLREGLLIISVFLSLFLIISLLTFEAGDPGWSTTGTTETILNAGGKAGAWLADTMLCVFGYSSYLFPFLLLIGAGIGFYNNKMHIPFNGLLLSLRCVGFVLLLLATTGLANLDIPNSLLPFGAGGLVGQISGWGLAQFFNTLGASLTLITILLLGLVLFTGASIVRLSQWGFKGGAEATAALTTASLWSLRRLRELIRQQRAQRTTTQALTQPKTSKPRREPTLTVGASPSPETSKVATSTFRKTEQRQKTSTKKTVPAVASPVSSGLPSLELLEQPERNKKWGYTQAMLEKMSRDVEAHLKDFGIDVQVVAVHPGPVITRFELHLAPGIKVSRITSLAKDLARSMSVVSVRVVEVIPGKSVIGLELPNEYREVVRLREILESDHYHQAHSPLSLALGKDIGGDPVVVDLAKMPHLLAAGTTGSGKSVSLNAMLLSFLYKATPTDVRFIMIDPKMLELSIYEGIPHLLTPVVTDMKEAANALRWCVAEMDKRYRLMAHLGVRNLSAYNKKIAEALLKNQPMAAPVWMEAAGQAHLEQLPYIVVVIDEFADMIMVVGKKVEELIARLAQKARAAGIHLILATQRPSVDVITGLIKANIPTRIAFQVSSRIDSRTILDQQGAEQLLGYGDMLYLPPGTGVPIRVHGAFVADDEVHRVVADWRSRGTPAYIDDILNETNTGNESGFDADDASDELDELYDKAVFIITESRRASISYLQRRLKIGYNRSARLLEQMEAQGVVSTIQSNGARDVLAAAPPQEV